MNTFSKHVYEMVQRVIAFAQSSPQHFPEGSVQQELLQQIVKAAESLSGYVVSQSSTQGAVKVAAEGRVAAREELRRQVEAIYRTARSLGMTQFLLPRAKHDVALVHVGQTWGQEASSVKAVLIQHQLPSDFLEKLAAAVDALQKAI